MKKRVRVAIIGLGSQGATYVRNHKLYQEELELCAIVDVNTRRVEEFGRQHGVPQSGWYYSTESFFSARPEVDVVFICTGDIWHYEQAKTAMECGYHVMLEKPAGVTLEQCRQLKEISDATGRILIVCYVLRYAAGYRKIKEIIDSGRIGRLMTIQGIEQVAYWHQAHSFIRGTCGREAASSSLFLQKCCHDTDLITWLTAKKCLRVSSYAHLTHFTPENAPAGATERCVEDCLAKDHCPYNAESYYYTNGIKKGKSGWPYEMVAPVNFSEETMYRALQEGPFGRCVYHCDNDVVDHQIVNMEMEDELLVTYTMSTFTPRNGRRLHIMGTKGDILADMDERKTIEVGVFGQDREVIDIQSLTDDLSGHGGGESVMLQSLAKAIRGEGIDPELTLIQDSVESHYICFAAEESRKHNGKNIEMDEFIGRGV